MRRAQVCSGRPFLAERVIRDYKHGMIFSLIGTLIVGLIVGLVARALMPGDQPMGLLRTSFVGIGGSFAGGFLSRLFFGGGKLFEPTTSGFIGSVIGAMVLMWVLRKLF